VGSKSKKAKGRAMVLIVRESNSEDKRQRDLIIVGDEIAEGPHNVLPVARVIGLDQSGLHIGYFKINHDEFLVCYLTDQFRDEVEVLRRTHAPQHLASL
jgi:plasmid stabilization system protein ParE